MGNVSKYFKVWVIMAGDSISLAFSSRIGATLFLFGKVIRFLLFLYFLYLLVANTQTLAGYSVLQVIFFFLTFNLIDIGSQSLFRGVYYFRSSVLTGQFDFDLVKPVRPLFRALVGRIDILDFLTLIPLVATIAILAPRILTGPGLNLFLYLLLLANSFSLALAFHIFIIGLGILTMEVDHAVWIYRDLTSMGKIPIDVYKEPVRSLLTNIIPVGVIMTMPAKALMNLVSPLSVIGSLAAGLILLTLSLKYWHYALTKYASASS